VRARLGLRQPEHVIRKNEITESRCWVQSCIKVQEIRREFHRPAAAIQEEVHHLRQCHHSAAERRTRLRLTTAVTKRCSSVPPFNHAQSWPESPLSGLPETASWKTNLRLRAMCWRSLFGSRIGSWIPQTKTVLVEGLGIDEFSAKSTDRHEASHRTCIVAGDEVVQAGVRIPRGVPVRLRLLAPPQQPWVQARGRSCLAI